MPRDRVFIGIGSNVDPEANIPRALELLGRSARILRLSNFRRTAPVGPAGQPAFVNGVAEIETALPPRTLKYDVLRRIEAELGRTRSSPDKYRPRPIDLDLLLYGRLVLREPGLTLPDPDLRERAFLARAVLELAPDLALPDTGEPLASLTGEDESPALPGLSRSWKERYECHEQDSRSKADP